MPKDNLIHSRRRLSTYQITQMVLGTLFGGYLIWRVYDLFFAHPVYGPETWVQFAIAGVILGSVYAIIAIGYTLVYGILFMINFAHGDIMMLGPFGGYFVFEALKVIPVATPSTIPNLNFWMRIRSSRSSWPLRWAWLLQR